VTKSIWSNTRLFCSAANVLVSQGNTYAIFVLGGTYDELKAVFDKLSEGAEKERFQALHDLPFGTYGQFYDKYGVQWIFKGEKQK